MSPFDFQEEDDYFEEMMQRSMFRSVPKDVEEQIRELEDNTEKEGWENLKTSLEEEGIHPSEAIEVLVQLGMISPEDIECLENGEQVTEEE